MIQFAIVKSRGIVGLKILPATDPLQDIPKGLGKGRAIQVTPSMWRWIEAQNGVKGYKYARSVGMCWINTDYDHDTPYAQAHAESIMTAWNFVSYEEEVTGHLHVRSFGYDEDLLTAFDPSVINWRTRPHLFWKLTATNSGGKVYNVGAGLDVFIPLLHGLKEIWIPTIECELFPELPRAVKIKVPKLNVRMEPDLSQPVIGIYTAGQMPAIFKYRLVGASVWGQTGLGWICLLLSDKPGQHQFLTSWSLVTPGVIPPAVWPPV